MTVRFVVLGCGRIGSMHAAYLHRRVAGAEVVGVFDVVAEAAENVGAELGVPVAADLEAALAIDADAVAICTSTDTHVDVMIAAAEAGRAIFCEQPISLDVAEVDRRSQRSRLPACRCTSASIAGSIRPTRRLPMPSPMVAIGDVEVVNITSRDPAPPPIAYIEVSGGIFNDMAIHDFDMARYVTGSEVESVYALGRAGRSRDRAGRRCRHRRHRLTHENGCLTTIDISRRAVYGYDQRVEAFGSGGMAQSTNHHNANALVATAGGYASPHSRTSSSSATPPAISISGRHSLPPLRTAPRHRSAVPTVELRSSSAWPPSARWTKAVLS